ncbi:MAG: hypothetical protein R6V05_00445 [Candidatus Brocadiia bacterium]
MSSEVPLTRSVVNYDQKVACELGLDCTDLVFLDWLAHWNGAGNMQTAMHPCDGEGGQFREYFWLYYDHVLRSLPILGIGTKRGLAKRLSKLVDAGVLQFYEQKRGKGRGTRTWYRFGPQYERLRYHREARADHPNASSTGPDQRNASSKGGVTAVPVVAPTTGTPVTPDCAVTSDCAVTDSERQQRARADPPADPADVPEQLHEWPEVVVVYREATAHVRETFLRQLQEAPDEAGHKALDTLESQLATGCQVEQNLARYFKPILEGAKVAHEEAAERDAQRAEQCREQQWRDLWEDLSEQERRAILEKVAGQVQNGVQLAETYGKAPWRCRPLWKEVRPLLSPQSQAALIPATG